MRVEILGVMILALVVSPAAVVGCGGDDDDADGGMDDDADDDADDDTDDDDADDDLDDDADDDTVPDDPILPSQGFLDRQAAYLAYCDDRAADGNLYSQICAAYTGSGNYNEDAIRDKVDGLNDRFGSCDFHLNAILRLLAFDRDNPTLPGALRDDIEDAVLNFKYWLDEPGDDDLQWWSENHQILYHTAEMMAGQLFPDSVFPNSGMTGADHVAHALPFLNRWLDHRGRFGFAEWHSPVYANLTLAALVNIAEFAEDEAVAVKAAMLVDEVAFDFAGNYFCENYATTAGRAHGFTDGLHSSTREPAWVLLGLGAPTSIEELNAGSLSAAALATSERYWPPSMIEDIAVDAADAFEHRQCDSLDTETAADYGLGYTSDADVMLWWGHTAYAAPEVIMATFQFIEDHDMWDGQVWSGIDFLRPLVGNPLLETVAEAYEPMARGIALERVSTYVYRTPHYQLAAAQDYKAAQWTGQQLFWLATLTADAYVYVNYPGGLPEGSDFGGPWTGGWSPRSTVYQNIGVFQYWRPSLFLVESLLFTDYSHAYFPKAAFDEYEQVGHWTIGRKGDAYVALWSENPTEWSVDNDYELIANARENVWIVEMGDADASGAFTDFVDAVTSADVSVGSTVVYESPSRGRVEVGRDGPMNVDGVDVDLGPYPRWDNTYSRQEYATTTTTITFEGRRLELDFETPSRRYWQAR